MRLEQWSYAIPLRLRALFRRRQVERELDEELAYHVEKQVEQNLAAGMETAEARRAALRALGGLERRKDECREAWGVAAVDRLRLDAGYALRTLRRNPGFAAGVVLILAIGISANASVFGIVEGVLLKPLPYRDSDRLVVVEEVVPALPGPAAVNPLHFREWRRACRCFEQLALSANGEVNLANAGAAPERVANASVTPNLFSMLGVHAELGRTFLPDDAQDEKGVVLISDALWRRRFGADPGVLGKTIGINGVEAVIVGVLPPGFRDYHPGGFGVSAGHRRIDVYSPWAVKPLPWWHWDNNYSYAAVARLAEGVSLQAALDELDAVQASIEARYDTGTRSGMLRANLVPYQEWVTRGARSGLLLLEGAVLAAFLVACLNVGSLMLVRATGRRREAGVRAALGASALQIFRGVLIESVLLAFAGAALGVALAAGFLHFFDVFAPERLPRLTEVHWDWAVLPFAVGLGIAATLACGMLPALRMTRTDPQDALRSGSRATGSRSRLRFRQGLVSLEVGLSSGLLIVAGLLLMSFVRLNGLDRGYDASNVLTAELSIAGPRYGYGKFDARRRLVESLIERLQAAPGVAAAGATSMLPLTGGNFGSSVVPEGEKRPPPGWPPIQYRFVSPDFFRTMGAPILAGRAFEATDAPRNVAVVSERLAALLAPDGDPLGKRFHPPANPDWSFEVLGVVPDVYTEDLASAPGPIAYFPMLWGPLALEAPPNPTIAIRTSGDPGTAAPLLRGALRSLDPDLPLSNVRTMKEVDAASLAARRFQLVLIACFGAASLLVAALGVYSVLAHSVANRTRELAIRLALGGSGSGVRGMVLRQGLKPVLFGLALAMAGALAAGRFLSGLLFAVAPADPRTIAAVVAVTLAAACLASWLPARRAARTPLSEALRDE